MMTDVMYAVPDNPGIRQVVIRSLFERAEISTSTEATDGPAGTLEKG
jgi:hypothetical protein